jgi:hypothetical protein
MPLITMRAALDQIHGACLEARASGSDHALERIAKIAGDALAASSFDTQERIARIIDPEVHELWHNVRDLETKEGIAEQLALVPRLMESREKAARVISESLAGAPKPMDMETSLFTVIADIRQKSGLGGKPMLSELGDAVAKRIAIADQSYPTAFSDEDIDNAAMAWMWSYANRIHDRYRPNDPKKDEDGLTTPQKLWDAGSKSEKEFARDHIRAAMDAVLSARRTALAEFASIDERIDAGISDIKDVLVRHGLKFLSLDGVEFAIRESINIEDDTKTADKHFFESAARVVMSGHPFDQQIAVTQIAANIGRLKAKLGLADQQTPYLEPKDVGLLLKFAMAYDSGAHGCNMEYDSAQDLAKAIFRALETIRYPLTDAEARQLSDESVSE